MKMCYSLKNFQKNAVNFAIRKKYSINAYEMGLGKTPIAIAMAVKLDIPKTLFVVPAFLIPNIKREILKFTYEECEDRRYAEDHRFYVVSYSSLKIVSKIFGQFDLIVADEAHYLKSMDATRTKKFHSLIDKHKPQYLLAMSGTPIKNRVPEIYSLLKLCSMGGLYAEFDEFSKDYWKFCCEFSNKEMVNLGRRKFTKFTGVRHVDVLKELIRPVYLRKRAEEVIELPAEVRKELTVEDHSQQDGLLKIAWETYTGNKESNSFSTGKAVNALSKVMYTVEFIKDNIEQSEKFLVYSDHPQAVKKIYELLGPTVACFSTGETPMNQRQEYIDQLNSGEIRVLVATTGSLSVGVNITGCNHTIFNDYPWVPADLQQAEKRTHRIGQKKTCFYYYVMSSSLDRLIFKTINKKRGLIDALEGSWDS